MCYDDELRLVRVETEGLLWNDQEIFTLDAVSNRTQHNKSSEGHASGGGCFNYSNTTCVPYGYECANGNVTEGHACSSWFSSSNSSCAGDSGSSGGWGGIGGGLGGDGGNGFGGNGAGASTPINMKGQKCAYVANGRKCGY